MYKKKRKELKLSHQDGFSSPSSYFFLPFPSHVQLKSYVFDACRLCVLECQCWTHNTPINACQHFSAIWILQGSFEHQLILHSNVEILAIIGLGFPY